MRRRKERGKQLVLMIDATRDLVSCEMEIREEKKKKAESRGRGHDKPSQAMAGLPLNPGGHWQRKDPGRLSQMALRPQTA